MTHSQDSRQSVHECDKFVSHTHRLPLPQEIFALIICFRGVVTTSTNSASRRINPVKNPNNPPANKRTHDFLACSTVSQPTALPPAPQIWTQCILNVIIPSNPNVAQRYIHTHTAHTVQQKVDRNGRSLAPLSGSSSNCTANDVRIVSVQTHTLHKLAQYSRLESRCIIKQSHQSWTTVHPYQHTHQLPMCVVIYMPAGLLTDKTNSFSFYGATLSLIW
jgi:hypothetical protein